MSKPRTRLIAATAAGTGLLAGLGLGVTGLAAAATTATTAAVGTAGSTGTAHALSHRRHGNPDHRWGRGALVQAVNGTASLTLDTPRGVKTVALTSTTVYKRGTSTVGLSDVKQGQIVRVAFVDPKATSLVAKTVRIEPARAAGYVTTVNSPTSFTITMPDGFTRMVQESSATVFRNAGAAGTAAEVTVGKFIIAEGTVDANGTTLDAARIGVGGGHRMGVRAVTPSSGTTTTVPGTTG
jgi:hypothetical protein